MNNLLDPENPYQSGPKGPVVLYPNPFEARRAALEAAVMLSAATPQEMLANADIILAWLDPPAPPLTPEAPADAQNPPVQPLKAPEATGVPTGG